MTTPRMRTAEGALAVIKTEDPETAVISMVRTFQLAA